MSDRPWLYAGAPVAVFWNGWAGSESKVYQIGTVKSITDANITLETEERFDPRTLRIRPRETGYGHTELRSLTDPLVIRYRAGSLVHSLRGQLMAASVSGDPVSVRNLLIVVEKTAAGLRDQLDAIEAGQP